MYQKVDTNLNFVDREKQVEKFWKENHIFEKSMEDRKDDPTYMFYDGPPTANDLLEYYTDKYGKDISIKTIRKHIAKYGYTIDKNNGHVIKSQDVT